MVSIDAAELARVIEASDRPGPAGGDHRRAAVFVLLTQGEQTNLLLIRRADRGDPWSSHVAFPGGHIDPADADPRETAYRETFEEVGIGRQDIVYVADLGHFQTRGLLVDLHTFVGLWDERGPLRVNPAEVAQTIEVPLAALQQQHQNSEYATQSAEQLGERLVYHWADWTIWGVTARIVHRLLHLIARLS